MRAQGDDKHQSDTPVNEYEDSDNVVQASAAPKPEKGKGTRDLAKTDPGPTISGDAQGGATRANRIYLKICSVEGRIASNISVTTQLANRDPPRPGDASRIRILRGEVERLYDLLEGYKRSTLAQREGLYADAGCGPGIYVDPKERIVSRNRRKDATEASNLAALIAVTTYSQQNAEHIPTLDEAYEMYVQTDSRKRSSRQLTLIFLAWPVCQGGPCLA